MQWLVGLPLSTMLLLFMLLQQGERHAAAARVLAATIRPQIKAGNATVAGGNSGAATAVANSDVFGTNQAHYQREQQQLDSFDGDSSSGWARGAGPTNLPQRRALHGLWQRATPFLKRNAKAASNTEAALQPGLEGLGFYANTRLIKYEPSLVDGKPYPVRSAKTNATTVFCLLPKNASTRLKALLAAASGMPVKEVFERTSRVDSVHQAVYPWFRTTIADYANGVHNPSHPRVVIVRNPYTRILSTYLDKYVGDGYEQGFADLPPKLPSFEAFVDALYTSWLEHAHRMPPATDEHIMPQTDQCMFLLGYRYDYLLKLELMGCWLPDLVAHLGAADVAKAGWDSPSSFNTGPAAERPCFFAPPGTSCERYWDAAATREDRARCTCTVATAAAESSGGSGSIAERDRDTVHVTNAATVVFKHYTRRAAHRITEMYGVDFSVLGYRRWDGVGPMELC